MGGWGSFDDDPPDEQARIEAENAVFQARALAAAIAEALKCERFLLTLELIRELNRLAVERLVEKPGELRLDDLVIVGSKHVPPSWAEIPRLLDEMLVHINDGAAQEPLYIAAYALWRINWIHPFVDGNGRTARAVAYLLLCARLHQELPGETTVIERLLFHKIRYWRALDAADAAQRNGNVDVGVLVALLDELLQAQLTDADP